MQSCRVSEILLLASLLTLSSYQAYSQSIYVDFHGNGGSFYSPSAPPPVSTSPPSSYGSPSGSPSYSSQGDLRAFEDAVRERQLLEQRRRELEEQLQREREHRLNTLNTLRQLQDILTRLGEREADERAKYKLKYDIVNSVPQFDNERRQFLSRRSSILQRLAVSINRINVPSPLVSSTCRSVLFLGMNNTPQDAARMRARNSRNPFDAEGRPYDCVFAFGTAGIAVETDRVILDHMLGDYDSLSEATLSQLGSLRGARIEELVVHSNGAKVAEVLLRAGLIRTKVLRILGGDGALMDLAGLQRLANEKGIDIYVYAIKGDPVPLIPLGWQIREWADRLREPLTQYKNAADATYQVLGIKRSRASDSSRVRVQMLSFPPSQKPLDKHKYDSYDRVIYGQRLQGCLDATGFLSAHCRIY